MMHRFTASQWLRYPVPFVFAFFADPQNLPGLMPRWQSARIDETRLIAPPAAPANAFSTKQMRGASAGDGSVVVLSFRPIPFSPIRLRWVAVISEFAWNERFCDVQETGPFAAWKHCHSVVADRREGVDGSLVTDDVNYEMKMGKVGELAHSVIMGAQVKQIFAYRQKRVAEILARIWPAAAQLAR